MRRRLWDTEVYPTGVESAGKPSAEMERRAPPLAGHLAHVVATLDVLATNQSHLDEALSTLAESHIKLNEAQIRTQQQFVDTDRRISNLASAIGELIRQMKARAN